MAFPIKKPIEFNFGGGIDTKTDPKQVALGKFLALSNMVYTTKNLLLKRNGFGYLPELPSDATALTNFSENLIGVGNSLYSYSEPSNSWVTKGTFKNVELSVQALIRNNATQTQVDTAVAPNGLICTVYTNSQSGTGYYYAIFNTQTGDNLVPPTLIPAGAGALSGSPRVFILGNNFIIVFTNVISTTNHLQYIAININTLVVGTATDISTAYTPASTVAFDGYVANNSLFLAWNGNDGGGAVHLAYLTSSLTLSSAKTYATYIGTIFSVTADITGSQPVIYVSFYNAATGDGFILAVNTQLIPIPTFSTPASTISNTMGCQNIASVAQNGLVTSFYELSQNIGSSSVPSNHIYLLTCDFMANITISTNPIVRSVGIASKAFLANGIGYFLTAYQSIYQSSYFLSDQNGNIVAKLAYENGGGYLVTGLPSVTAVSGSYFIGYLYKDLIQSTNPTPSSTNPAIDINVYSQTGINLVSFEFGQSLASSVDIASNLHLSGGFLWMYDGNIPIEHNFFLFPDTDSFSVTTHTSGGGLAAQKYYVQLTYEWTDSQGNIHRSAPSIPYLIDLSSLTPTAITFTSVFSANASSITVSSATGLQIGQVLTDTTTAGNIAAGTYITSISGTTIGLSNPTVAASASSPGDTLRTVDTLYYDLTNIPSLRLTYKTANPVKIVAYRWSTAQQSFYQTTSTSAPIFNPNIYTTDFVTLTDKNADNAILGNSLIYTTGGVVENIGVSAVTAMTEWDTRLFYILAEDENLLGYSKQVVENTPVEPSDLFTLYVSPSIGAQGPTGPMKCLAPMDDKIILYKKNAAYYINGTGPDNTGANSTYSQPIFITGTVGTENQASLVVTDVGHMFQSDKGIWLLGRNLQTSYIGQDVEAYTKNATVTSALCIPETTQVRFTLDSGITLFYDYFYGQWATASISGISSALYNDLQCLLQSGGATLQETPGIYLDGATPVLMGFTTSWIKLTDLQGYQRAYFFMLLGTYLSPHKLSIQVAYDYGAVSQSLLYTPNLYSPAYGGEANWGAGNAWGGINNLLNPKINLIRQRCEAVQLTVQEVFDPFFGTIAGPGLTLSSILAQIGVKKGYYPIKAANTVG